MAFLRATSARAHSLLILVLVMSSPPLLISRGEQGQRAAMKSDYKLAPRDKVQFHIYGEADPLQTLRISAEGGVSLPLVGTVVLQGKTLREAERYIEELYVKGGFFIKPQVTLSIESYDQRFVTVLGHVKNQGQVLLPLEADHIKLIDALAIAGGLATTAKGDAIQIKRASGAESEKVNVEAYLNSKGNDNIAGLVLQAGDVVVVGERAF